MLKKSQILKLYNSSSGVAKEILELVLEIKKLPDTEPDTEFQRQYNAIKNQIRRNILAYDYEHRSNRSGVNLDTLIKFAKGGDVTDKTFSKILISYGYEVKIMDLQAPLSYFYDFMQGVVRNKIDEDYRTLAARVKLSYNVVYNYMNSMDKLPLEKLARFWDFDIELADLS